MMVSNDFAIRMLGKLLPQLPSSKHDMLDIEFEGAIRKIGAHQKFVDISRCSKLTTRPFKHLSVCKSLLYLDVSFTKIYDLNVIVENCDQLRALNVSGLNIMNGDFSRLKELTSLEVLQMRLSNVTDIDWLSDMSILRSLDLGEVTIPSIRPVRCHSRLEELALDGSAFSGFEGQESRFINLFWSFENLKVLNICETELDSYAKEIRGIIGHDVYIETTSRRIQLFAAAAENDSREMHRLITSGMLIDVRATEKDEKFLLKLWKTRCVTPKIKGPFFLCSNIAPELRPTPLHMAIAFNANECFQILLDYGADTTLSVWFGDVKEDRKARMLVENKVLTEMVPRSVFNCRHLIDVVYKRNLHRLTADMYGRKVANWKSITTMWHKRLVYVIEQPPGSERISMEDMDMRATFAMSAEIEAPADGEGGEVDAEEQVEAEGDGKIDKEKGKIKRNPEMALAVATAIAAAENAPDTQGPVRIGSMSTKSKSIRFVAADTPDEGRGDEGGGEESEYGDTHDEYEGEEGDEEEEEEEEEDEDDDGENREKIMAEEEGGGGDLKSPSASRKKKTRKKKKQPQKDVIMPRKFHHFGWRDHSMVIKLTGAPLIKEVPIPVKHDPNKVMKHADIIKQQQKLKQQGSQRSMGGDSSKKETNWMGDDDVEKIEMKEVPYLGAKSFWLESRALLLEQQEIEYNNAFHLPAIHEGLISKTVAQSHIIAPEKVPPKAAGEFDDDDDSTEADGDGDGDGADSAAGAGAGASAGASDVGDGMTRYASMRVMTGGADWRDGDDLSSTGTGVGTPGGMSVGGSSSNAYPSRAGSADGFASGSIGIQAFASMATSPPGSAKQPPIVQPQPQTQPHSTHSESLSLPAVQQSPTASAAGDAGVGGNVSFQIEAPTGAAATAAASPGPRTAPSRSGSMMMVGTVPETPTRRSRSRSSKTAQGSSKAKLRGDGVGGEEEDGGGGKKGEKDTIGFEDDEDSEDDEDATAWRRGSLYSVRAMSSRGGLSSRGLSSRGGPDSRNGSFFFPQTPTAAAAVAAAGSTLPATGATGATAGASGVSSSHGSRGSSRRMSSSERRSQFLQELSQRVEERYMPVDDED